MIIKDGINSLFKWNKLMNLRVIFIVCLSIMIIYYFYDEFEFFQ